MVCNVLYLFRKLVYNELDFFKVLSDNFHHRLVYNITHLLVVVYLKYFVC